MGAVAAGRPGGCPLFGRLSFLGSPNSVAGERNRSVALETCEKLGVPVAVQKLEGPSTCLTFLGLELDTEAQEIRLPEERVRGLVRLWQARKKCTKREPLPCRAATARGFGGSGWANVRS